MKRSALDIRNQADYYSGQKKPKTLYRYEHHSGSPSSAILEKHKVSGDCNPQMIDHNYHGTLWRCRQRCLSSSHDFYGYELQKSAKSEEIDAARASLEMTLTHLQKLTKEKWRLVRK